MSGTAVHMVRLYVSVPPSQPPSRNSLSKNSARIAARLAAKGSTTAEEAGLEYMALRPESRSEHVHALQYVCPNQKSRGTAGHSLLRFLRGIIFPGLG